MFSQNLDLSDLYEDLYENRNMKCVNIMQKKNSCIKISIR